MSLALDLFAVMPGAGPQPAPYCVIEHPGPPVPKGRPRFRYVPPGANGRAGFVHVYTPKDTEVYETALKWRGKAAMRGRPVLEGALAVRVFAMMPVPASWSNKARDAALSGLTFPAKKPDADNILKMLDALNGIVFVDDAQIVRSLIIKEYAESPGLIVEIYLLS